MIYLNGIKICWWRNDFLNDLILMETVKNYSDLLIELELTEEQAEELLSMESKHSQIIINEDDLEKLEKLYKVDKAYAFCVFSTNTGVNIASMSIEFTNIEEMKSNYFKFLNGLEETLKRDIMDNKYKVATLESELLGIEDNSNLDLKQLFKEWKNGL